MKKILIFALIPILVGIGCNKEVTSLSPVPSGSWNWISTWADVPESATNPVTPQNSGIQENLVINSNFYWKRTQNDSPSDSGTFSLGHGSYTPYKGAFIWIYDSINYFHSGTLIATDYYKISNDTLTFCGCYRGIDGDFVKMYIKQKHWIHIY